MKVIVVRENGKKEEVRGAKNAWVKRETLFIKTRAGIRNYPPGTYLRWWKA